MTVVVFVGPTLAKEEARVELDAVYLPSAAQGDVYRATLERPAAIGIIDGYFERVPAVWHKEILWAMSQGIHVYGSASMGALRAAELEAFGMTGVGAIFEAFRSGELEDDDEVAVAHAPAEDGYRCVSEAMVNIRATLAKAEVEGAITAPTRASLERLAKHAHYADRSYGLLLAEGKERGLPAAEIAALRVFLRQGRVDQKRADALAMLRAMRELGADPEPKRVDYAFAYTDAWDQARRQADLRGCAPLGPGRAGGALDLEGALEELRVSGAFGRARDGALARALLLREAQRQSIPIDARALQATADAFRRERGLLAARTTEAWLQEQDLDVDAFWRLMLEEAQLRWVEARSRPTLMASLPSYLRASGQYGALVARARHKRCVLEELGLQSPSPRDADIPEADLLRWYFSERLRRPLPLDLEAHARAAGFPDVGALRQAALREYCYERSGRAEPPILDGAGHPAPPGRPREDS